MSLPSHGANPELLATALGLNLRSDIIDFSVNTNPFGPPKTIRDVAIDRLLALASAYPEQDASKLAERLAEINDVKKEEIIVGNGAAELIFLLANVFQKKKVRIVEPAFSEYRDACLAHRCEVDRFVLTEPWQIEENMIASLVQNIDLLFLCRPNNPTGVRYANETIVALIKEANRRGVYVVIDEAFYDFCKDADPLHTLLRTYPNVIILRSLTKMYAIAGLRLGYAIATEAIIRRLKELQPPWSVNGIAQELGRMLLDEGDFVKKTAAFIEAERTWLKAQLEQLHFDVSPSTVNFFVLSEKEKGDLKELLRFLLKHGIVARHTYNFRGLDGNYLRFAVKDRKSNEKLLEVLKKWRRLR